MSAFGIYFGPKMVSLVETKGRKIISNSQVSLSVISTSGLEEKVPDEIKIVALLKDELRKRSINPKDAAICISGKDWIIRTFDIPMLPRNELNTAVGFEVRKYIPFKVEDLVSDFEIYSDRLNRKNRVLFVGIRKDSLNKYLSIASQLGIQPKAIEYVGFSLLRVALLSGVKRKGIIGIVNVDFSEDEEVNFMVLENGFPLFSRDINLISGPDSFIAQDGAAAASLEKLKNEIRISLDYYDRTFHSKNIEKIFFITGTEYRADLAAFIKELGHPVQFLDMTKLLGAQVAFSPTLLKGYSISLSKVVKTGLKIDLLAAKNKAKAIKVKIPALELMPFLVGFKIEPLVFVAALLICMATLILGSFRTKPLRQELSKAVANRPKVAEVSSGASFEELSKIEAKYKNKVAILDNVIKKQMFFTDLLNVLPKVVPEGTTLSVCSIRNEGGKTEFQIKGTVCLYDSDKEFQAVNNLLSNLMRNNIFNKYFEKTKIVSLDTEPEEKDKRALTNFEIYGLTQKGKGK